MPHHSIDKLRFKMSPERRAANLAETERLLAELDRDEAMHFRAMRDKPGITVAALREVVESLGGTLEITARFPPQGSAGEQTGTIQPELAAVGRVTRADDDAAVEVLGYARGRPAAGGPDPAAASPGGGGGRDVFNGLLRLRLDGRRRGLRGSGRPRRHRPRLGRRGDGPDLRPRRRQRRPLQPRRQLRVLARWKVSRTRRVGVQRRTDSGRDCRRAVSPRSQPWHIKPWPDVSDGARRAGIEHALHLERRRRRPRLRIRGRADLRPRLRDPLRRGRQQGARADGGHRNRRGRWASARSRPGRSAGRR